ncbi:MAG: PQQ-dependent sugar dehydrogenase, partial [Terriglobales bacterium]
LGEREHVLALPAGGEPFTRTLAFSPDGKHLRVSAGSNSNYGEDPDGAFPMPGDPRRAAVTIADADGQHARLFASGLRNAVGLGFNPDSGALWAAVNERDLLGDNLPPDYFTSVRDGGFYGWPYSYIGQHVDDRVKPQRPDLVAQAIVPDVLLRAHIAPLQFQFYEASQFPAAYRHGAFLAEHGSWNRSTRQGYDVMFIPFRNGKPSGAPQPFLQGFIPDASERGVYGRPVGVAVAADGSLLVSDDGGHKIWRIHYGR